MFSSLQILAVSVVLSLALGFGAGWRVKTAFVAQDAAQAAQQAHTTEREGVRTAFQSDLRYIDRLHEAKGQSDANSARLKRALAASATDLNACHISGDILRLLQPAPVAPAAPGPAAKPQPAPAPVAAGPGTTCTAVIESYQQNRDEVATPNAIQLELIQEFYRDLQRRFNRP